MVKKEYICRVCGLEQEEAPWGEDGKTPSFEICVCCGAEFGYNDIKLENIVKYRNDWIKNNAEWKFKNFKPNNWNLEKQLENIPSEYLMK